MKFNGLISTETLAERIGFEEFNDRSAGSFWNIGIFSYVLLAENSNMQDVLVLVQFTISVIMIIGTLIVSGQLNFMKTTDLGFDKDDLMVMTIRDTTLHKSFDHSFLAICQGCRHQSGGYTQI